MNAVKYSLTPARLAGFILALLVSWGIPLTFGQADPWPFLPNDDIGARDFKAAHPTFDGRGVVVAILDTGIDAFAPGLEQLPGGGKKLIQVRDFSHQGDWEVELAEREEIESDGAVAFRQPDGVLLRGAGSLAVPPPAEDDPDLPVYIGVIPEERFLNARAVNDLNDDGDETDRFGFLVYLADRGRVEEALGIGEGYQTYNDLGETAAATVLAERESARVWVVVVDTNGDGDLANEKVLRDYRVNFDTFRLTADNATESRTLMAWEVNVFENEDQQGHRKAPTVEFHFDDGAHGSHCAGIATGYRVSGQEGLDGVAPGAFLMSLKIGDNRLAGGATVTESMKAAYDYAAGFEEKYGIPVIINMSYGIGSVEEGDDAMGRYLDDLLAEHPTLYVCTSAGNEGPGLSSVGLPATSYSLISSGAYLSVATGHSLYNTPLARPTLFTFSSRGGEAAKPDVVSPGSALSTVPGYVEGSARFQGTSMASPQTAGAVACLVSAARQEDRPVHWGMVKRALIAGAAPVDGLELYDQGGGLVQLAGTWEVLKELSASETAHRILWYRVETACPFQADAQAEAAYWRVPGGIPVAPETVEFTVHPVFHPDLTPDEKDTFFRSFNLKSEADWLKLVPAKSYIRGDMGMSVVAKYDAKKIQAPGAYSARIIGSLDGGDLGGLAGREFYLWNTLVVGHRFGAESGYQKVFQGKDLAQAWIHHHYVEVPAGASAMRVRLEVSPGTGASKGARVRTEICDPEGGVHGGFVGYATVDGAQTRDMTVLAPDLYPGIWEINVAASRTARDLSDYQVTVAFDGYDADPEVLDSLPRDGAGEKAAGTVTLTRSFTGTFKGQATATIEGFRAEKQVEIEDQDHWSHAFTLDRATPRAVFHLEMDEKTANLFTDCAVLIQDGDGQNVSSTGFSGVEVEIGVRLPAGSDSGSYTLKVIGGFALAQDMKDWGFDLEEKYLFASAIGGEVSRTGGGPLHLYCGVPTELDVSFDRSWPAAPDGLHPFGSLKLLDENLADKLPGDRGGRLVLEVPIRLQ